MASSALLDGTSSPLKLAEPTFSGVGLPSDLRPGANLLVYYTLSSLLLGPFFFFALIPLYFRYHTLHYQVDAEGITMRWGILFRREISLTYARIQDIHLSSNLLERWLGLAKVQVQTASGSAAAEMTIEGLLDSEGMRDFLYARMRGASDLKRAQDAGGADGGGDSMEQVAEALRVVAREIRALREELPPRGDR